MTGQNGEAVLAQQIMTPEQKAQVAELSLKLNANIQVVLQNTLRGILTGLPPGMPQHEGIKIACFQWSYAVATLFQADIATMAKIRAELKQATDEGFKKAPMNIKPMAPGFDVSNLPGAKD
jgi:hypothetical protein